jgi:CDP-diacylglycerol--inositol 3-phosphatidyltransferase
MGSGAEVFWYVPNLIGYLRVLCTVWGLGIALRSPAWTIALYFVSFVCDELDGRFARMLQQTSTLGAVLDMVTDRLSTTGLLLILAVLYPGLLLACLLLIFLDIFSHWSQMYAQLLVGAASHKDTASSSWLVRKYYQYRLFMGFCCVCCEVLYLCAYGLAFPGPRAWQIGAEWNLLGRLPSQLLHQLPALQTILGPGPGVPLLALLALAAVPGFVVKQICNVAQLRTSANMLVRHDKRKRS